MTPRTTLILSFVAMFFVGTGVLAALKTVHVSDEVFVAGFLGVLSAAAILGSELVGRYFKRTPADRDRR